MDTAINRPVPKLILLIGPSGTGKTTYAQQHFNPEDIFSSDDIRDNLPSEYSKEKNKKAFLILFRQARENIMRIPEQSGHPFQSNPATPVVI